MSGSFDTRTRRTVVAATGVAALAVSVLATLPAAPAAPVASEAPVATSAARASSALTRGLVAPQRAQQAAATQKAAAQKSAAQRTTAQASRSAAAPATAQPVAWTAPKRSDGSIDWTRMPVLEPGVTHPAVRYLQARVGVKRTGFYGPMTLALVTQAQEAAGLPAEGYVGPRTWELLYTPRRAATTAAASSSEGSGSRSSSSSSSSASTPRTSSAPSVGGRVCPAPGSAFGSGWGAPRGGRSHMGVDLMGRRGSPIVAIEDGYIVRAGRQSNGALRIVMQGVSGSKFYYGHQDAHYVSDGQRVKRGQVIGTMGDTGSPGAVHLHFEYWKSGGESAAVDPYPLLKSLCW
jgi:murein DD-endopeptidase MepM/ murein hydrolase activator NlpD